MSKRSTGDATPAKGKVERVAAEVGDLGSSVDLWGITQEEPSGVTCFAESRSGKESGDGPRRGLPAPNKVRKLQITLYRKAKSEPGYRFWSLNGEVQRADVLAAAWQRVKANGGAAGVDGERIADIAASEQREQEWLESLRQELVTKKYRPAPVRRVMIPKASGGQRPLGIPTVRDRVVQMAVYLVLMPIFEADFHPRSFGFRPKRSAHGAVEAIRESMRMGKTELVDADLAKYFDTIPHAQLLREVARRVSDGAILKLIKKWLRAPILEEGDNGSRTLRENRRGTPQGGVISPLLANIYLNPLDHAVNERCREKPRMIRYADDLVILCRPGEGQGMKERLARWLQAKGLELNETKTQVTQTRESGFEFLGFAFRWQKSRKGTSYVHTEPSPKSRQTMRDRVREMTGRNTTLKSPKVVVQQINKFTRGWNGYFGLRHAHASLAKLNRFTAQRLRRWLWRKHGSKGSPYQRWPEESLYEQYGLYRMRM